MIPASLLQPLPLLVALIAGGLPAAPGLSETLERAAGYARAARADNTRRAYRAAWADFMGWCQERGLAELPAAPETVGAFLTGRAAMHKAASLQMRLVAIRQQPRNSLVRAEYFRLPASARCLTS